MIDLNARFSVQTLSGVQRVAYELGRRLLELRPGITAIAPSAPQPDYDLPVTIVPPPLPLPLPMLGGHGWEQTVLRARAKAGHLLVGLGGTGPVGIARQIVMIHDVNYMIGPEGYSRRFRTAYRLLQGHLARTAVVCTVSHWSARTIGAAFGVDPARFTVIPNAADHILAVTPDEGAVAALGLAARPYVLCVGNANPNKNFATALAAYAGLDDPAFDLVIVGGGDPRIFGSMNGMVAHPHVHRLPRISDARLRAVIEGAGAFLMPSLLEGFGIPAIEAMALGTPVIAARAAALPEVCGDAAMYVEPRDAGDMARAMVAVMGDAALKDSLISQGHVNVGRFDWDRSATALDALIEKVLHPADRNTAR